MRLRTVPARSGATWVRQGFRAFGKRPIAYALLFTSVLLAIIAVRLVPLLVFVVLPLMPLVTLGFMLATRRVLAGEFPTPRVFIEPLRAGRAKVVAMLQLGVVYALATLAIMWLGDLIEGGGPDGLVDAPAAAASAPDLTAESLAAAPGPLFGLLLRFGLAGLLSIPFWHAPALVFWDGHGCAKALFSSTVACWRNRGAFAVYGVVWLGVLMGLSLVFGLLFAVFAQPETLLSASVPLSLILATVYYASLYFTFADCFVPNATVAPSEPEDSP
ncbi:MAG: hypothetical protein M3O01_01305 [Pseudomonadota bacterium]|nr:hypothetical protein [Pseudomonadota bacterium]